MRPFCSIIIPSHNCLEFLPSTLSTISLQRRDDIEVILIDDASTDGTAEWLSKADHDGYALTVISQNGVGPSQARNVGISRSRGDLIAFLDADDHWWPNKLDSQIAYHRAHPKVGLSFTDYIHVTTDGASLGTCFDYWKCQWIKTHHTGFQILEDAEAHLLATNVIGTSCAMVRRDTLEAVGGFRAEFKSAGDWDLWLRMAAISEVAYSNSVTMTYLMRPGSVSTNRRNRIDATRRITNRYTDRNEQIFKQALRVAQARTDVIIAEAARMDRKPLVAAFHHIKALPIIPSVRLGRNIAADFLAASTTTIGRLSATG